MNTEIPKKTRKFFCVILLTSMTFLILSIHPSEFVHLILAKSLVLISLILTFAAVIRMAQAIKDEYNKEEEPGDSIVGTAGHSIYEVLMFLFSMILVYSLSVVVTILLLCVALSFPHYSWFDVGLGTIGFASAFHWRFCIYEPYRCQCEECLNEEWCGDG